MKQSKTTLVWKSALYRANKLSRFFSSPFIPHILFLSCLLFTLYLAFFKLGNAPLENWDEAWYAEVTKQMLLTKDFFVLHWNHAVWLDKPPLYMWLSAFTATILGLSDFSSRFISAVCGVLTLSLITRYAYKQFGKLPAFLAFVTLGLNNLFVWRMRSGNLDLLVSFLILLVFFLQISKNKYKYALLGFVFSLIYLTKASIVLFPLSIFVITEITFNYKNLTKNYKNYLMIFGIFFLLPGLWLLIGSLRVGHEFWQYYLLKADQGVGSVDIFKYNPDYLNFTYYSLQRRFFYLFIIGIIFSLKFIKQKQVFLVLLYSTLLLLELSFTTRSNNWYLIPSMPFWSLLIAYGMYQTLKIMRNNVIVICIVIGLSSYIAYKTFTINILPILDTSSTLATSQSSKFIKTLTNSSETIIRLDHLYPTTIYYSDRKVLVSPEGDTTTKDYWIQRKDVLNGLQTKKYKWLVGTNDVVANFTKQTGDIKLRVIKPNDTETILEVL